MGRLYDGSARAGLLLLLAGCAAAFPGHAAGDEPAPGEPDLLLVTLDTTRADHLGCYGFAGASTPNLDRLAVAGVRFDRAISPVPLTAPAHASLMTGLVPRRHGVRDNALHPLAPEVPTLARLLADAGFDTAAAVSAAVLDRGVGLDSGFRLYDDSVRVGRRSAFHYEERAASQTDQAVLGLLDRLESPFFLWVHYFDPHLPYVPPPPYDERFADRPYDGEIAFVDAALGRLLEAVRRRSARLLVVVAGDHGESLGEHGEKAHGVLLYQGTQHVPLLFSGPGLPRGRVVRARAGLIDVMPTLLDLLHVAAPRDLDGRSLRRLLVGEGGGAAPDYETESLFPRLAYGWAPLAGLVRGDLVLIDAPRPELYDLGDDPRELRNLWPDHASAAPMMQRLRALTAGDEPAPVAPAPEVAERRMRLESLGYVGGGTTPDAGDAIDPKEGIRWLAVLDDARAAVQQGRPNEALAPLGRLLEQNPRNLPARLTLVAAHLAAGDAAGAVAAARSAAELRPDDDLVVFHLANALSAASVEHPEAAREAAESYERALALNPRRAEAYLNYAALLARQGPPERIRALLLRADEAGVADPDLAIERAVLELRAGHVDAAVDHFERALALNPYAADAVEALARIALRRDRPEEARRHLRRLLELTPPDDPQRASIERELRTLEETGADEP